MKGLASAKPSLNPQSGMSARRSDEVFARDGAFEFASQPVPGKVEPEGRCIRCRAGKGAYAAQQLWIVARHARRQEVIGKRGPFRGGIEFGLGRAAVLEVARRMGRRHDLLPCRLLGP